jgi:hypothetical protein
MNYACAYSTVTLSTVICDHSTRLKGWSVVNESASGVTLCLMDSGVSVAATSMWAATTGTTIVFGPRRLAATTDNMHHIEYPEGGLRCINGLFAYFPQLAGTTLHIYYG